MRCRWRARCQEKIVKISKKKDFPIVFNNFLLFSVSFINRIKAFRGFLHKKELFGDSERNLLFSIVKNISKNPFRYLTQTTQSFIIKST